MHRAARLLRLAPRRAVTPLSAVVTPLATEVVAFVGPFDLFSSTLANFAAYSFVLLVLALGLKNPRILLYAGLTTYLMNTMQAQLVPEVGPVYPLVALALAVLHSIVTGRFPRMTVLRGGAFPATVVFFMLGVLTLSGSVDVANSIESLASVLVAIGFAGFFVGSTDRETQRRVIHGTLLLFVAVSLALVVVAPDIGVQSVAFRWRGLANNPNTLGLVTVFALLTVRNRSHVYIGLLPVLVVILGTGSRTSALALVLAVAPNLIMRQRITLRRMVVVVVVLMVLPLAYTVFTSGSEEPTDVTEGSITRTRNNRQDSWNVAADAIGANPLRGIGVGNDRTVSDDSLPVHSSVLRPMVEVGVLGIVPVAMIVFAGWSALRRGDPTLRPLLGAMFVTGIFEGWLFAGGSSTFALFLIAAYAATRRPEVDHGATPDGPSTPAVRRAFGRPTSRAALTGTA